VAAVVAGEVAAVVEVVAGEVAVVAAEEVPQVVVGEEAARQPARASSHENSPKFPMDRLAEGPLRRRPLSRIPPVLRYGERRC
jgi:hypothetical protein